MIACSWKESVGIECPMCGFQRSTVALVKGNVKESFVLFPATLPFFFTLVVLALHLKFKFKHGAYTILGLFCCTVLLILINYIPKVIAVFAK